MSIFEDKKESKTGLSPKALPERPSEERSILSNSVSSESMSAQKEESPTPKSMKLWNEKTSSSKKGYSPKKGFSPKKGYSPKRSSKDYSPARTTVGTKFQSLMVGGLNTQKSTKFFNHIAQQLRHRVSVEKKQIERAKLASYKQYELNEKKKLDIIKNRAQATHKDSCMALLIGDCCQHSRKVSGELPQMRRLSNCIFLPKFDSSDKARKTVNVTKLKNPLLPQTDRKSVTSHQPSTNKVNPSLIEEEGLEVNNLRRQSTMEEAMLGMSDEIPQGSQGIKISRNLSRMQKRDKRNKFLCYPEDRIKDIWEIIVSLTLLIMCILTPIYIAFHEDDVSDEYHENHQVPWHVINNTIDCIFGIDIAVIFCTAYYDADFKLIDDRKKIAMKYICGMFTLDVIAIFPFESFFKTQDDSQNLNGMIRIARLGRLYKLLKLTRMLRVLKLLKQSSNLKKITQDILKIGNGFERIFFFILMSVLICHISACLWVFFCHLVPDGSQTWLNDEKYEQMANKERYLTSFYFILTTFSTVGYGDISATNSTEMIFCILIMCIGVTAFAAGTSELTNLLQNYDQENASLQEKILILNRLYKEYCLPLNLYENVKQSLSFQYRNDIEELVKFVEELPNDLRVEVSFFIFERTFKELKFFKDRPLTFIAWVCPLLKPLVKSKDQYIFFEDDDVGGIYFFQNGQAGYVLPRHKNIVYLNLNKGHHFGVSCIVASFMEESGDFTFNIDNWITHRSKLKRQFTIQCQDACELLTFSIQDLNMMKNEFYEIYSQIFENSLTILRRTNLIKLKAIRFSNRILKKKALSKLGAAHAKIEQMNVPKSQNFLEVVNQLKKQETINPLGENFRPIEQIEVDEESSLFYTSDEDSMTQSESESSSSSCSIHKQPAEDEPKMKSSSSSCSKQSVSVSSASHEGSTKRDQIKTIVKEEGQEDTCLMDPQDQLEEKATDEKKRSSTQVNARNSIEIAREVARDFETKRADKAMKKQYSNQYGQDEMIPVKRRSTNQIIEQSKKFVNMTRKVSIINTAFNLNQKRQSSNNLLVTNTGTADTSQDLLLKIMNMQNEQDNRIKDFQKSMNEQLQSTTRTLEEKIKEQSESISQLTTLMNTFIEKTQEQKQEVKINNYYS